MQEQVPISERFDKLLMGSIAGISMSVSFFLIAWACVLVASQCLGWLKAGDWQPVPAYAIFLSEQAQDYTLKVYDSGLQPLNLTPAWGDAKDLDQIAESSARNALGARKILRWVLELPLAVWLVAAAIGVAAIFQSATESRM